MRQNRKNNCVTQEVRYSIEREYLTYLCMWLCVFSQIDGKRENTAAWRRESKIMRRLSQQTHSKIAQTRYQDEDTYPHK